MPDDTGLVADETPKDEVIVVPDAGPAVTPASTIPAAADPRASHVVSPARRRALMPWAIVAGTLVILGAIAIGLTYTPMFHAKTITVTGEKRLSEARILKIAQIGSGTDVFHADLHAAEARLERNPWVADAVVSRHLPSSISIRISERRAVALTRSADGRLSYLAVDGGVLAPAHGSLPLPQVEVGAGAAEDPSILATGAAVAQALPPSMVPEVATITVDAQGAVVLVMRSGVTATYGDGSDAEAKGQALKAVIDYAATNGRVLVSVDIEVPGAPTAVFAGAASTTP